MNQAAKTIEMDTGAVVMNPLHELYLKQLQANDNGTKSDMRAMRSEVLDVLEEIMGAQRSHLLTVRAMHTTNELMDALEAA